ncbi:helix-turn-helix transcriptional regulator [Gordonia malaquae]|uniref:helix-turn-helix transcriptional regulator n=1 Tax=Gordonia malaquae TaxID=410332 RepID=UPI0030170525
MSTEVDLDNERYDRNARDMHRARRKMLRRLVEIRIKRDHPQAEVARVLGVNRSTICRFENELENANPTLDTVLRYAHAVGASLTLKAETIEEADSRKLSYPVIVSNDLVDSRSSWTSVVSR